MLRFILEKCDGTLVIENKRKKLMIQELINKNFDPDPVKRWKANQVSPFLLQYELSVRGLIPNNVADFPVGHCCGRS